MNKRQIGYKYENIAVSFLKLQGYDIIKHNFYTKFGEIDIVAKDNDTLVFIEVKYRSNKNYGTGFEAVDRKKQLRIINSAKYYIYINKINENSKMRFDVLSIDKDNISIIKNAFY